MENYFSYLSLVLQTFFTGGGGINERFARCHEVFASYSGGFSVGGWIFYVLMIILAVIAVGALGLLLFIAIRRAVLHGRHAKSSREEKMLQEIERLNLELYDTKRENDKLIGLTREYSGDPSHPKGKGGAGGADEEIGGARFTRLPLIDEKYKEGPFQVVTPEDSQNLDLASICARFRDFACSQMKLYYTIDVVRQFFSAMGTGKFIILEGISGTGKTSLPYCMGRFFQHSSAICAVQPNWRDRSELLGYYNDFTKKFTETSFLAAVYEASYRDDPFIIVLDEMNLARVEYYFAEFLSIMEMPRAEEWLVDVIAGGREDDPKMLHEGKLLIPQNIWFVGTANNDDSTFTITDKVYDRAMSLFFENKGQPFEAEYTEALPIQASYLIGLYDQAKKDHPMTQEVLEKFSALDDFVIEHFRLAFGNRIMKQLQAFVPCYVACGGTELDALDYCFKSKILKKFEVLNVGYLRDELIELNEKLTELFGEGEFPLSRAKIALFLKMSK